MKDESVYPLNRENHNGGLSKREYFTAKALNGGIESMLKFSQTPESIAEKAIQIADAVIAKLEED